MAPGFSGHRLGIPESSDKQAVETKEHLAYIWCPTSMARITILAK